MAVSVQQFADDLLRLRLVTQSELTACRDSENSASSPDSVQTFAKRLVKCGYITAWQAQRIYAGKADELRLGRYLVTDKLGQGGMGLVLKACDERMDREVAVKVLSPKVTKSPELLERFQREVRAAAKLDHQNIITAYDADEANGTHFLVMQFVDGTDLQSLVKSEGPLSVEQTMNCVLQAAAGLQYAHESGIVHRDVKPANMLIDRKGVVRILDMGLARFSSADVDKEAQLTGTGMVMGTIDYMAPEQAVDTRSADARADIYSLGGTLHFLLTGTAMFGGDSLTARLLAHQTAPIPELPEAVRNRFPRLQATFEKLVAKDPNSRFPSMSAAVEHLTACQAGTETAPGSFTGVGQSTQFNDFLKNLSAEQTDPAATAKTVIAPPADEPADTVISSPSDTNPLPQMEPTKKTRRSTRTKPQRRSTGKQKKRTQRSVLISALVAGLLVVAVALSQFSGDSSDQTASTPGSPENVGAAEASGGENPRTVPSETSTVSSTAWISLFDGADTSHWQTLGPFRVVDGLLIANDGGANAVSKEQFADFELEAEWRLGPKGNSGIYYRETPESQVLPGFEYQILDDKEYTDNQPPKFQTGSLYGLVAPSGKPKAVGEWNTSTIICQGTEIEHKLNGRTVVRYSTTDREWETLLTASEFARRDDLVRRTKGHILLQGHTGEVAFRSVRIRELSDEPPATESSTAGIQKAPSSTDGMEFSSGTPGLRTGRLKMDLRRPFVLEAWCLAFPAANPQKNRTIAQLGPCSLQIYRDKEWQVNAYEIVGNLPNGAVVGPTPGAELPPGKFAHIAGQWDGSELQLFLNGRRIVAELVAFPEGTSPVDVLNGLFEGAVDPVLSIGNLQQPYLGAPHGIFQGVIRSLRVSNEARYHEDFSPAKLTSDSSTVALYDFTVINGNSVRDLSGNGYDATIGSVNP